MERNQFFMVGILLICLGLECRAVESVTLTPPAAKLLAHDAASSLLMPKIISPPTAVGWGMVAFGLISVFHAYGMKKGPPAAH